LVTALNEIKTEIPIVIRLSGTNAKEGLEIIKDYGLPTVSTMSEAAKMAIELSRSRV
jgi:succinyl-CoA synthetase beta subunit